MNGIPYKNLIIYFWSGTGNSYRVSDMIGEIAEKNGLNKQICSIDKCNPNEDLKDGNDKLIGIVYPTHGFTAPWCMLKFAWKLPRGNSNHIFCAATRAGLRFKYLSIPGIGGSAAFIVALILLLKGYSVRGCMSVDMPSNWYSLHPIQNRKNHETIINRAGNKIANFAERILLRRKVWFTLNNLYELIGGVLLSLVSVGYLVMGRFFLAKLFFANKNCDGCGICADYCTFDAIKMWGIKKPRPFWKYNCESCMRCSAFCPRNAVEAGHSWGVILYFIAAVPVGAYIFSWLSGYFHSSENPEGNWITSIINFLYFYPAVFISYYVFSVLIRIPAVNWIFTHTTLTHLPFWKRYREPNTKLKDIAVRNMNIDYQRNNVNPAV